MINKFNKYLKSYAKKELYKSSKKPKSPETTEDMYYRMGEKNVWDIVSRLEFDDLKETHKT